MAETRPMGGDRYGPEYRPVRFWTVDVSPSGGTGPLRLLDEDPDRGQVFDPTGWVGPDGEVLLTWARPAGRGWWIRRSPNGEWGTARRLGRGYFQPSAIARDGDGRIVATGSTGRGGYVALVRGRTVPLGKIRSIGSGPQLAVARDGFLVGWLSGERAWFARLDRRGRVVCRSRLAGWAGDAPEVGVDRRGNGVVLATSAGSVRVVRVDPRGNIVGRQVLGPRAYARPVMAVDPSGRVTVVRETEQPRALSVAWGRTRGRLRKAPPIALSGRDAAAGVVLGEGGDALVTWRDAPELTRGEVWLQRWRDGRADAPVEMASTG